MTEGHLERLKVVEDRYYKTYQARLELAKRIQRQGTAWNWWLITSSLAVSVASIALIRDPKIYGGQGDVLMASLSLLAFTGSLVVSGCRFGERSRDAFYAYRAIQKLSVQAERARKSGSPASSIDEVERLEDAYDQVIDSSENHREIDHIRAKRVRGERLDRRDQRKIAGAWVVEALPYASLVASLASLIPVFFWIF